MFYFFLLRSWFHFDHRDCCWRWILSDYPVGGGMFETLQLRFESIFHQMEHEYLPKHWSQVSLQPLGQHELISAASRVVMDTIKAHAYYESKLSEKVRLCLICVCLYSLHLVWSHKFISCRLYLTYWFLSKRGKGPFLQPSLIDWR